MTGPEDIIVIELAGEVSAVTRRGLEALQAVGIEPEIRGEAEWRPRRLRLVGGPADGETVEVYSHWDRVVAKGALYVPHSSEPDCYVPEAAS